MEKHSKSVGTKIFSSPEQTSSSEYDHRTDIYSLAMIICVLFSDYITVHEEKHLLSDIRNVKLHKLNLPLEL
jgi:serine/threonine protein kinase